MCGVVSSLQCWTMCWSLSICERDFEDRGDLRNDEEVRLIGRDEAERQQRSSGWSHFCRWLFLASRISSWVFTVAVLVTLWDLSLHWTIIVSLAANMGISVVLGVVTFWKHWGFKREGRKKKDA